MNFHYLYFFKAIAYLQQFAAFAANAAKPIFGKNYNLQQKFFAENWQKFLDFEKKNCSKLQQIA